MSIDSDIDKIIIGKSVNSSRNFVAELGAAENAAVAAGGRITLRDWNQFFAKYFLQHGLT